MYKTIKWEKVGEVCVLTLNRPEVLNALSTTLKKELVEALDRAEEDSGIRAVVMIGAGDKAFSAGQDLNETSEFKGTNADAWIAGYDRFYTRFRRFGKPLVAAINGYCVGAGWQITLLADVRVASETARFAMTEIDIGIPCVTGSALLWPILGKAKTAEVIMTGRWFTVKEAKELGVVTRIVPKSDLLEEAVKTAKELGQKPLIAFQENKKWLNVLTQELHNWSMEHAKKAHTAAYESGVPQELMQRFKK